MERRKTIQELTSALKTLRLQEADLTAQLEQAVGNREHTGVASNTTGEEREKDGQSLHGFAKGDRIWIQNKLHKPANWHNEFKWIEQEGKTATVTDILVKGPTIQVHFVTDNGVKTWRAPNNVRLLRT
jgi:hypothetical protein